jgi:hypothetical protein
MILLLCSAALGFQLYEPFFEHYNTSHPRLFNPQNDVVQRIVVVCVCQQRIQQAYALFSRIARIWHRTGLLFADKSHCESPLIYNKSLSVSLLLVDLTSVCGKRVALHASLVFAPIHTRWFSEVFWAANYTCGSDEEIGVYRGTDLRITNCSIIHYLELAEQLLGYGQFDTVRLLQPKTSGHVDTIRQLKSKFAAYSFGKAVLRGYYGEFVFRHAVVDALKRRVDANQTVDALGYFSLYHDAHPCPGSYVNMPLCFAPYRFALVMENSAVDGYVSEKLLNAAYADAVPVYFGAPDLEKFVNKNAVVHCTMRRNVTAQLRKVFGSLTKFYAQQYLKTASDIANDELQQCVEKILFVQQDVTEYKRIIREPLLQNKAQYVDGTYTACQFAQIVARIRPAFVRDLNESWSDVCKQFG